MTKTTKYMLFGLLAAAGIGYWFYDRARKENEARLEELKRKYANQDPPSGTNDWKDWIKLIISIYGETQDLWEPPNGIFYGTNVPRIGTDKLNEILGKIKSGL